VRIHGRRYSQRKIKKQTSITAETRDGVLWDLDWDNLIARVKIQGSNEYVNVHFPRNEATVWGWMRLGNAVRVIHRGGVRGYSEIVGHGCAIPTPLPGNLAHPPVSSLSDGVMSGCEITAAGNGMYVTISDGTYRIGGVTYNLSGGTFGYYATSETEPPITTSEEYPEAVTDQTWRYVETSETEPPMATSEIFPVYATDEMLEARELDPAPAEGLFRYDAFVVGVDGIIDYLKGTASSVPVKPTIPVDHVLLGDYILVIGGITEITQGHIGLQWSVPVASSLFIDDLADFDWDEGDDYPERTITVYVRDQYGWLISGNYTITLYLIGGTGNVYSGDDGYNASSVTQAFTGSSYGFSYQRDQTKDPETSPNFMATSSDGFVSDLVHMALLDIDDDEVTGAAQGDFEYNNRNIVFDTTLPNDETASGDIITVTFGESVAFGKLCYPDSSEDEWMLALATNAAVKHPALGVALESKGNGETGKLLLRGLIRSSTYFSAITLGFLWLSDGTAGGWVNAAPGDSGDIVQHVGWVHAPNYCFFNPDYTYIEVA